MLEEEKGVRREAAKHNERSGKLLGGKYRLQEVIGSGGQAVVYRALDEKLDKEWAVKEVPLPPDRAAAGRERSLAECYVLKNMDCPYFPRLVDFYEEPEQVYLVMDLVKGITLEETVGLHGRLQEEEVLDVGIRLAEALTALHQASPPVLYLDLKPANVILTGRAGLKLVDFGSAVIAGKERESFFKGTRGYAAPELAGGLADVRSDVYSLGRTLAYLVTGKEPIGAAQTACCRAGLSDGLAAVLERCMKERPEERYGGAEQVRRALENCRSGSAGRKRRKGGGCRQKRWNGRQIFFREKNVLKTEKRQWFVGFLMGMICMGLLMPALPDGAGDVQAAESETASEMETTTEADGRAGTAEAAAPRQACGIVLRDEKGRRLLIRKGSVFHTDSPLYLELRPEPFAEEGDTTVRLTCGKEAFSFAYCSTALP